MPTSLPELQESLLREIAPLVTMAEEFHNSLIAEGIAGQTVEDAQDLLAQCVALQDGVGLWFSEKSFKPDKKAL